MGSIVDWVIIVGLSVNDKAITDQDFSVFFRSNFPATIPVSF
jgi:hypothetical protein